MDHFDWIEEPPRFPDGGITSVRLHCGECHEEAVVIGIVEAEGKRMLLLGCETCRGVYPISLNEENWATLEDRILND